MGGDQALQCRGAALLILVREGLRLTGWPGGDAANGGTSGEIKSLDKLVGYSGWLSSGRGVRFPSVSTI